MDHRENATRRLRVEGHTFVLKGRLPGMTHDEARQEIERQGGQVRVAVSARVDYLVFAGAAKTRKWRHAQELGVPVLTPAQFVEMLEGAEVERSDLPEDVEVVPDIAFGDGLGELRAILAADLDVPRWRELLILLERLEPTYRTEAIAYILDEMKCRTYEGTDARVPTVNDTNWWRAFESSVRRDDPRMMPMEWLCEEPTDLWNLPRVVVPWHRKLTTKIAIGLLKEERLRIEHLHLTWQVAARGFFQKLRANKRLGKTLHTLTIHQLREDAVYGWGWNNKLNGLRTLRFTTELYHGLMGSGRNREFDMNEDSVLAFMDAECMRTVERLRVQDAPRLCALLTGQCRHLVGCHTVEFDEGALRASSHSWISRVHTLRLLGTSSGPARLMSLVSERCSSLHTLDLRAARLDPPGREGSGIGWNATSRWLNDVLEQNQDALQNLDRLLVSEPVSQDVAQRIEGLEILTNPIGSAPVRRS